MAQFISLVTTGKKSSFDSPNQASIQVFHLKISLKTKRNVFYFLISRGLRKPFFCIFAEECIYLFKRQVKQHNNRHVMILLDKKPSRFSPDPCCTFFLLNNILHSPLI